MLPDADTLDEATPVDDDPVDRRVTPFRVWEATPWAKHARCRGEDPGLFFGPPGERPETRRVREWSALQFCSRCTVVNVCRSYARRHREHGVWGGETEADRAAAGFAPEMPIGNVARIAQLVRRGEL